MAKRRKGGGGRITPRGTRPRNWRGSAGEPTGGWAPTHHGMPRQLRRAPAMFDILLAVSTTAEAIAPVDRFTGAPDLTQLPAAVIKELGNADNLDALTLLAHLLRDDDLTARLIRRHQPDEAIQAIIDAVGGARIDGAVEIREPYDEQRQYVVGARLANGELISALIRADVLGSLCLTDAFAAPVAVDNVLRLAFDEPELRTMHSPRADIRRDLDRAVYSAFHTVPPPATDTWPAHALLVQWILELLPSPSPEPDWEPISDKASNRFIDEFLASEERRRVPAPDNEVASILSSLLWFKDGYTNGDLYRWGPNQIGILLSDWALRKLVVPEEEIRRIPEILRALIPWAHRQLDDLTLYHTDEALSAVDHYEPMFRAGLVPDRRQGIDALLDAAAPYLGFEPGAWSALSNEEYARWEAARPAAAVGGPDVLEQLTAEPLPAPEDPDLSSVDEPYRSLVGHVAERAATIAADLYGPEYGAAASRIAVAIGEADGAVLARGKPNSAVASVVWMAAAANRDPYRIVQKDIKEECGTKVGPKERARTFTGVLGGEFDEFRHIILGSPDFLVSSRRQELIDEHRSAGVTDGNRD